MTDPLRHHGARAGGGTVGLVLINAVAALLACTYGLAFAVPQVWRGAMDRAATPVMLALLAALMVLALLPRQGARPVTARAAALLCLGQLGLALFFALPNRLALPAIALSWLGAALLARWLGWAAAVGWALSCGFVLYAGSILAIPIDVQRADMLPFIAHAIGVFRAGGDPYLADFSALSDNPFFYPPLQWLVFLPAQALGLDLRVTNLLSAAGMVELIEWRARAADGDGMSLRAGVYPLLLSALALPMMYAGQVWPYWLAVLGFALLAAEERWVAAAVVAALAVGTRQTALVPAGAVLLAMLGRVRLTTWLAAAAAGAATLAVTVAPFVTSRADLRMLLIDGPRSALAHAHAQGNPGDQIALSNLLDRAGLVAWDGRVEVLLAVATVGLAWVAARRGIGTLLMAAGTGWAITISANAYVHPYYYVGGLLFAGAAGAPPARPDTRR